MNAEQILELSTEDSVIKILCEVLQRLPSEVSKDMTLFGQMGIESVELLEVVFVLEQEFGFKIEPNELWNLPNYIVENKLFSDGKFSEAAIELIKLNFKSVTQEDLAKMKSSGELTKHITISDLIDCISRKQVN